MRITQRKSRIFRWNGHTLTILIDFKRLFHWAQCRFQDHHHHFSTIHSSFICKYSFNILSIENPFDATVPVRFCLAQISETYFIYEGNTFHLADSAFHSIRINDKNSIIQKQKLSTKPQYPSPNIAVKSNEWFGQSVLTTDQKKRTQTNS